MLVDLKLKHKGLLLIAVPLSFQLILFISLVGLLERAEHELLVEKRKQDILAASNNLLRDFIDAGVALYMFNNSKEHVFVERYEDLMVRVQHKIGTLKVLLQDSPNEKESVEQLGVMTNHLLDLLARAREALKHRGSIQEIEQTRTELASTIKEIIQRVRLFVEQEQRIQVVDTQAEARTRFGLIIALVAFLVGNIAIAIGGSLYFSKTTTERLGILMSNTLRLAKSEKFVPPIQGRDEIGQLDKFSMKWRMRWKLRHSASARLWRW
jgi:CHASE3 domain sensor protein